MGRKAKYKTNEERRNANNDIAMRYYLSHVEMVKEKNRKRYHNKKMIKLSEKVIEAPQSVSSMPQPVVIAPPIVEKEVSVVEPSSSSSLSKTLMYEGVEHPREVVESFLEDKKKYPNAILRDDGIMEIPLEDENEYERKQSMKSQNNININHNHDNRSWHKKEEPVDMNKLRKRYNQYNSSMHDDD
jgi:hypothetical protein